MPVMRFMHGYFTGLSRSGLFASNFGRGAAKAPEILTAALVQFTMKPNEKRPPEGGEPAGVRLKDWKSKEEESFPAYPGGCLGGEDRAEIMKGVRSGASLQA